MASMKKTYYYDFLVSKKEEEIAALKNLAPQVTRTLVEIRDQDPINPAFLLPVLEQNVNLWKIRKCLEKHEIATGKIILTHDQVFEHVFRHSTLESAKSVVTGSKVYATVCDMTDETTPLAYGPYDENTFFVKGLNDEFVLGVNMDVMRFHGLNKDINGNHEIGIFFDPRTQVFYVKIFAFVDRNRC